MNGLRQILPLKSLERSHLNVLTKERVEEMKLKNAKTLLNKKNWVIENYSYILKKKRWKSSTVRS